MRIYLTIVAAVLLASSVFAKTSKPNIPFIMSDDPSVAVNEQQRAQIQTVNQVIDEFWDYSDVDRVKAIRISRSYHERFGNPATAEVYTADLK